MRSLHALPWAIAGAAFVAYPALRPYADESSLAGLAAMGSTRWLVAHLLAMVGFVALVAGLQALSGRARLASLAVVLLLPYYGGETFGLYAIGRAAVWTGDVGLLSIVDGFRYQPVALTMFGAGLVLLAVVGVRLVRSTWHSAPALRAAALATGLGLVLYLPQFYATPGLRIAHGVMLGLGCFALAASVVSERPLSRVVPGGRPAANDGGVRGDGRSLGAARVRG